MSEQRLYEGHATKVEVRGRWLYVETRENRKPIGFEKYVGQVPRIGDKISVLASEGSAWYFSLHRDAAITTDEGSFDVSSLPNAHQHDRNAVVVNMILNHLQHFPTVCSDDLIDDAVRLFPESDPRWIGHGFRILAERGIIHRVGYKRSRRTQANHAREISIWEATKPKAPRYRAAQP